MATLAETARELLRAASDLHNPFEERFSWYDLAAKVSRESAAPVDGRSERVLAYLRAAGKLNRKPPLSAAMLAQSFSTTIELESKSGRPELGASKMLGPPHLPAGWAMPGGWGRLPFYLQLRLSELARMDVDERLPKSGLLSLFQDPSDLRCQALLTPEDAPLVVRTDLPTFPCGREESLGARAGWVVYLNDGDAYDYSEAESILAPELKARVDALLGFPFAAHQSGRRLFGRPLYWQGEDEAGDEEEPEPPDPNREGELLLLQSVLPGSDASLHHWIDAAALKRGDFAGLWADASTT